MPHSRMRVSSRGKELIDAAVQEHRFENKQALMPSCPQAILLIPII
jgi:hypothetical protein